MFAHASLTPCSGARSSSESDGGPPHSVHDRILRHLKNWTERRQIARHRRRGSTLAHALQLVGGHEGGSSRRAAATAAIEFVGGSVDCFYYAFGDDDVVGIVDFPDDASATAVSLMINSTGPSISS
jgi:hypothetical protein